MYKKSFSITAERIFFYLCLLVTAGVLIFGPPNPTLDGPSHLYNARIAGYVMSGNGFIKNFFSLNTLPIPNLTEHYLLTFLCNFMSFTRAERLLQVVYLLSFCITFRLVIKQFNSSNIGLSIFALPFSLSFLYYLGFYNFLISFSFLFGIIIYYHKAFTNAAIIPAWWKYVLLCILAMALYFTNGLAFLFAGFILFLYEVVTLWPVLRKKVIAAKRGTVLIRLLAFALVWLPGLISMAVFLTSVKIDQGNHKLAFAELFSWLINLQPLVVFTGEENVYTRPVFYLILISLIVAIYYRVKNKGKMFSTSDIFFIAFIFTLSCFFIVPDGASVGMMSARLCYYLFVFLILWIAMQNGSRIITWVVSVAVAGIHFFFLINVHTPVEAKLNKEADIIRASAQALQPNSTVFDLDATDNWLYGHYGDYLTEDKPLVIIPNYEPNDRWFGIVWNDEVPQILFNGKGTGDVVANEDSRQAKQIDYVFIHGDYDAILHNRNNEWPGVQDVLTRKYSLLYVSPNNEVHIFELKK